MHYSDSQSSEPSTNPIVIAPDEDILMSNVSNFEAAIESAVTTGKGHVIVDLERVEYLSSLGIGALVRSLRRAREHGGELKLINVREELLRILRLSGVANVLDICTSEEEAVAAFGANVGNVERRLLWTIPRQKKDNEEHSPTS